MKTLVVLLSLLPGVAPGGELWKCHQLNGRHQPVNQITLSWHGPWTSEPQPGEIDYGRWKQKTQFKLAGFERRWYWDNYRFEISDGELGSYHRLGQHPETFRCRAVAEVL